MTDSPSQQSRRQVLYGLVMALGGATALANSETWAATAAGPFYTADELKFVTRLADIILPRTDSPGAIDASVPKVLDQLMASWASQATQARHRAELAVITARLTELGGKEFGRLAPAEQVTAVTRLDADAFAGKWNEPTSAAYRGLKNLIAQAYYASEAGATQELQYDPVPGSWQPNRPLKEVGRTWAT